MKRPSLTLILSGIFLAYISHSLYTIYGLFNPEQCTKNTAMTPCYHPYLRNHPNWQLKIYTSLKGKRTRESGLHLIWNYNNISISDAESKEILVSIPASTKNNGTLYVHVVLLPHGENDINNNVRYAITRVTTYAVPQAVAFNLMGDSSKDNSSEEVKLKSSKSRQIVTHWRSQLTVNIMNEDISLPADKVPGDIAHHLFPFKGDRYYPPLFIDELNYRTRDLMEVNATVTALPLTVNYAPISFGKLRLWVIMLESMRLLETLGFTEKDTDEMKGIFADTNLYFLLLTFLVSALHILFDFLAFKNDVSYWKNRQNMVGLSTRVVLWRCASTIIIFFYLLDEDTSLLVLIPSGIGAIIEVWKVKKALKVSLNWSGWKPSVSFGSSSSQEKVTEKYDSQAMKYLSYLLYPLLAAGAVYSLIYTPHKSWYSWCLKSLVNGVYAFGFLFMLPQLFVNYKLKSVAHLPWRAFMYKAFNTFIDDIFAFIITMPIAHRLACFRDDVVFLIYLYQRWLYPVDKTRVNEYGQSFEAEEKVKTKKEKTREEKKKQ